MKKYAVVDKYFDGYNLKKGSIIFTVNEGIITSEHVATDSEIKSLIADNNEVVDLRGNFVSPGLIDSHDHFMLTALKIMEPFFKLYPSKYLSTTTYFSIAITAIPLIFLIYA